MSDPPALTPHLQHQRPQQMPQGYPQLFSATSMASPTQSSFTQPSNPTSVKHEHYHYHYPTKDNYFSGNHPEIDNNGLNRRHSGVFPVSTQHEVYSHPVDIMDTNDGKYKNQYKGDPYRKRTLDDPYFPIKARSEDNDAVVDEEAKEIETTESDKNNRKLE